MVFSVPTGFSRRLLHLLPALALYGAVTAPAQAEALSPAKLYEKLGPSIWRVYSFDAQGKAFAQGSGVVIDKDTVLTNCAVVLRGASYQVKLENQAYDAKLMFADPVHNLCQLSVKNMAAPAVIRGDSEKVGAGDRIFAFGLPRGAELTLNDGLVSTIRRDDAQRRSAFQISAQIPTGSTGGGVFNEEGELIGISLVQNLNGQITNLAIPINWLQDLPGRSADGGMTRFLAASKDAEVKAAARSEPLTPAKLYEKLAPSVWRVYAFDAQGKPFSQGSGVVIAKDTMITNCHVVARGAGFQIKHDNQSFDAQLVHADPARDLCQLSVRNLSAPAVTMGDSTKLATGDRIFALGSPRGLELTLSDGLVSALRRDDAQRLYLIQITAPISPGSSGGGIFTEDGRLVGITTLQFVNGQNLNLAVPINWLAELAQRSAAGGMAKFISDNKAADQKAIADKAAADKAAAEKVAADKAAADKIVNDRVAAEKAAFEREVAKRVAAEKEAIEREAAARIAAERAARPAAPPAAQSYPAQSYPAPTPAPAQSSYPIQPFPAQPVPVGRPFADLNDIERFKLVAGGPGAIANYQRFLTYNYPRAFAVTNDGRTWGLWSRTPNNPDLPKEPSVRVVLECERAYKRRCVLYAVDNDVVYNP